MHYLHESNAAAEVALHAFINNKNAAQLEGKREEQALKEIKSTA